MASSKSLSISGLLFTVIIISWPLSMSVGQPQGSMPEIFTWIMNHVAVFRIQFILASLIAPTLLWLMLNQRAAYPSSTPVLTKFGESFFTAWLLLVSISYLSQAAILVPLIRAGKTELAGLLCFHNPISFSYFLNQLGYLFWALGALSWFTGYITKKGILAAVGWIYLLSAILSLIAFTGLITESEKLNSLTFISGILLVPIGILTMLLAKNARVEAEQ